MHSDKAKEKTITDKINIFYIVAR